MSEFLSRRWARRAWLRQNVTTALMAVPVSHLPGGLLRGAASGTNVFKNVVKNVVTSDSSAPETVDGREELAQQAVDAARRAGAQYAEARLTSTVRHYYSFGDNAVGDLEDVGIGVRALVNGYWGFSACPSGDTTAVERLARAAVAQAAVNARGAVSRTVDLGQIPPARGTWATPVSIDPFTVPLEEKHAFMRYWDACASKEGLTIDHLQSHLHFERQERVVATSDGGRFTQTVYESGGTIAIHPWDNPRLQAVDPNTTIFVQGIETAGRGWELFLDAKIPEQIRAMPEQFPALDALQKTAGQALVGRYTLVCDGATMAAILNATLGIATQLDRALGYEANAGGTSFLDDPLGMLGTFHVASSLVNVTANRSAPAQLATVKWDDEGVVPPEIQLVKNGVLTDFQTTREQAAWLASYYAKAGRPVRSNGCAATENALGITLQQMPNLSLDPGASAVRLDDLIANVKEGILMEQGKVMQTDAQARNGILFSPRLRKITNGRLGPLLANGVVMFNTLDFWNHVTAVGGPSTRMVVPFSQYPRGGQFARLMRQPCKGEPPQVTSHSVQAVAATITNQPVIDPSRKA